MGVFDGLAEIFVGTFGEPSLPAQYTPAGGKASPVVGIFREPAQQDFDAPAIVARVVTFDCAEADIPLEASPGEQSADVLAISGFVRRANGSYELKPELGAGVTRRFAVRSMMQDGTAGMVQLTLEEIR
jgi:hypothetical protein